MWWYAETNQWGVNMDWFGRKRKKQMLAEAAARRLLGQRGLSRKPGVPFRIQWWFYNHGISRTEFEHCLTFSCSRHNAQLIMMFQCRDAKNVKQQMAEIRQCGACNYGTFTQTSAPAFTFDK
jgi:hypothetical protein